MSGKTHILVIISSTNKALAFEWMAESIDHTRFSLHFILLNHQDSELERFLKAKGFPVLRVHYQKKQHLLKAFWQVAAYMRKTRPAVVHCHLFEANIVGLTAAKILGVKKRIYTRHHSTLQHLYYPKGVKYDRWCNRMSTHIIAISEVVKKVLIEKEQVSAGKISLIPHGFRLDLFEQVPREQVEKLRQKYQVGEERLVIGMISRYLYLKGVPYMIEAYKTILKKYPGSLLILANAQGDYAADIKQQLKDLPAGSYLEIAFEPGLFALYQLFDVFVHIPIDADSEAFGQTYVEALAAGIPSVFTLSGIAHEFIRPGINAKVVDYMNSAQVAGAIIDIAEHDALRHALIAKGKESVKQFDLKQQMHKLQNLYLS